MPRCTMACEGAGNFSGRVTLHREPPGSLWGAYRGGGERLGLGSYERGIKSAVLQLCEPDLIEQSEALVRLLESAREPLRN